MPAVTRDAAKARTRPGAGPGPTAEHTPVPSPARSGPSWPVGGTYVAGITTGASPIPGEAPRGSIGPGTDLDRHHTLQVHSALFLFPTLALTHRQRKLPRVVPNWWRLAP